MWMRQAIHEVGQAGAEDSADDLSGGVGAEVCEAESGSAVPANPPVGDADYRVEMRTGDRSDK
jgi:hypothetical protein